MWETDAQAVAKAIATDFPDQASDVWWIGSQPPAARLLDCVLSLRRNYNLVVVPRVKRFLSDFPAVRSCDDLAQLINGHASPKQFAHDILRIDSAGLGNRILAVAEYLIESQQRFPGRSEEERLRAWAEWTRPGDYFAVGIRGFALAGFQYLRMLFGADTTKPDVHIIRYVSKVVGREVSAIHALYVLERAGEIARRPVRPLDNVIWRRGQERRSARPTPLSSR